MAGKRGRSGRRSAASFRQSATAPDALRLNKLEDLLIRLKANADQLPDGLYHELKQTLVSEIAQTEWRMERIHVWRYIAVRIAAHRGSVLGSTEYDNNAFKAAAVMLKDTPAASGATAMKASYYWIERAKRQDAELRLLADEAEDYFKNPRITFGQTIA